MTRSARRLLASRLRALREQAFEVKLTQDQLAAALGGGRPLSSAAISNWENGDVDKWPSDTRIVQYALIFSTPTSLGPPPHVPVEAKLDKVAKIRFHELRTELLELREGAEQEARRERSGPTPQDMGGIWHHNRDDKVFVVAPEIPPDELTEYARPDSPNYVRLARYGDLDAFFEIYVALTRLGYRNLSHRSAQEQGIGMARNLVLIGGPAWNSVTRSFLHLLNLPIKQHLRPAGEPDYFTTSDDIQARPTVIHGPDDGEQVVEDVGLFVRAANPTNPETDVTICSGVYTHGVLGAVHLFTNPRVAADNADMIRDRLGRQTTSFAVLFSVKVVNGRVPTPYLSNSTIDCVAID